MWRKRRAEVFSGKEGKKGREEGREEASVREMEGEMNEGSRRQTDVVREIQEREIHWD